MGEAGGVGCSRGTPTPTRFTVLIADDHPIYRGGLVNMLERSADFVVTAEVGDGDSALREILRAEPDLAVVDLRLPGLDGIGVARSLGQHGCRTRVVIVSAYESPETILDACDGGAWAYVNKATPPAELYRALREVAHGQRLVPEDLRRDLSSRVAKRGGTAGAALSARELQVLQLTARGLSAPQIADELYVGTATVKTHLQRIYDKLDVSDRAAAVAQAHRRGLLE